MLPHNFEWGTTHRGNTVFPICHPLIEGVYITTHKISIMNIQIINKDQLFTFPKWLQHDLFLYENPSVYHSPIARYAINLKHSYQK